MRLLKKALAILLGLIVGLFLCEVIVRTFQLAGTAASRAPLHANDPDTGWTCRPHCDTHYMLPTSFDVRVLCNASGLRDREHALEKPPGVRRVVVLGDSYMWGYGVENEEMFSSQLEGLLPASETINLGVNGFSTVQELIRYETKGERYAPDWVVLAFCWNDLEDNFDPKGKTRPYVAWDATGNPEILNRPVKKNSIDPFRIWLGQNVALSQYLEYASAFLRMQRKMQRRAEQEATGIRLGREMVEDEDGKGMFSLLDVYAKETPELTHAWDVEQRLLERLRDRVTGRGARLFVTFVAVKETRSEEVFRKGLVEPYSPNGELDLDWDRPAHRLEEICKQLDVPYVDTNPAFRAHADPTSLFLHHNNHWSAAGHRVAADVVAHRIQELEAKER